MVSMEERAIECLHQNSYFNFLPFGKFGESPIGKRKIICFLEREEGRILLSLGYFKIMWCMHRKKL